MTAGYRHQPTGSPTPVPEACAATLHAADQLARLLGLDLPEEFRAMYDDASRFLCTYPGGAAT